MISNRIIDKYNLYVSYFQFGRSQENNATIMFALALCEKNNSVFVADCDSDGLPLPSGKYLIFNNWHYNEKSGAYQFSFLEITEEFLMDQEPESVKRMLNGDKMQIKGAEPVSRDCETPDRGFRPYPQGKFIQRRTKDRG